MELERSVEIDVPEDIYEEAERRHRIHGGYLEDHLHDAVELNIEFGRQD